MAGSLGAMGDIAGMVHRTGRVEERVAHARTAVANATTPAQTASANRNLSAAQFHQQANRVANAGTVANATEAASGNNSGLPDLGDPNYTPPNSIRTGLYT